MIDALLGTGLGATAVLVALFFRQLTTVRHQMDDLGVQVSTLRILGARKLDGRPHGIEPPESVHRKGNLWVVPPLVDRQPVRPGHRH